AMLMPALSKSRERAHTASCVSNLKQFGVNMTQYTADNKNWYPQGYANNVIIDSGMGGAWDGLLTPYFLGHAYLGSTKKYYRNGLAIFRCPGSPENPTYISRGYGMSGYVAGNQGSTTVIKMETYYNARIPVKGKGSEQVLVVDWGMENTFANLEYGSANSQKSNHYPMMEHLRKANRMSKRHNETVNYLRKDGVVKNTRQHAEFGLLDVLLYIKSERGRIDYIINGVEYRY
ncbi:MAG: DUF1559 domain-containing protein, partial [Lentisphaeria bacterium]|nr:DUF1559 domain-containing protein [Lentisphaeria bacterium]